MGNKQSKKKRKAEDNDVDGEKRKEKGQDNDNDQTTDRSSLSHSSVNTKQQHTYAQVLQLIQDELLNFVPIDLSGLILSFIPRSTIGDESVKYNFIPYG